MDMNRRTFVTGAALTMATSGMAALTKGVTDLKGQGDDKAAKVPSASAAIGATAATVAAAVLATAKIKG